MKAAGIIKEVDKLGRIVIPKEYRKRFGLTDKVEIAATEEGILIRSPRYKLITIGCGADGREAATCDKRGQPNDACPKGGK